MKRTIYIVVSFVLFVCLNTKMYSQDIHLSHVFNTSIVTNPAKSGLIYGNQRAVLSYRDQWSIAKSPFKTYFVAADAVFGKVKKSNLGIGVYAVRDVAGTLKMGNTQAMGSVSAIVPTGKKSRISLAIQGGYSQQSINTSGMEWDSQYQNGAYNEGSTSGENFDFSPFGFADFNAGFAYQFDSKDIHNMGLESSKRTEIEIGFAVHHLLEPKFQYSSIGNNRLYRKYLGHFNGVFKIKNSNFAINPAAMYVRQGPYQEISAGMMVKIMLKETSKHTSFSKDMNLSVGGFYRYKDAFVPSVFFEYDHYSIGATFGLNHSYIRNATSYFAGYEIVLRFINF